MQDRIAALLSETLSPNAASVRAAEESLDSLSRSEEFPRDLLLLIADGSRQVDHVVRHAGAIYLKNLIRRLWDLDAAKGGLSESMRTFLKANIFEALDSPSIARPVQAQLLDALGRIAASDFPLEWRDLLSKVVKRHFQPSDASLTEAVRGLQVVHAATRKYGDLQRCEEVLLELSQLLPDIQAPLLSVFAKTVQTVVACSNNSNNVSLGRAGGEETLKTALTCATLCVKVFISLNSVDLPEFFELHLSEYMAGFVRLLQLPLHGPWIENVGTEGLGDDSPRPLEELKTLICRALRLYADRYQEEFQPFVPLVVHAGGAKKQQSVWGTIRSLDASPRFDFLIASAVEFLSSASRTKWTKAPLPPQCLQAALAFGVSEVEWSTLMRQLDALPPSPFEDTGLLRDLLDGVLIPNIPLRDCDLWLLSDSPLDFVRRDVEGCSQHLPRRAASLELVRGLSKFHAAVVQTALFEVANRLATQAAEAGGGTSERGARLLDSSAFLISATAVKGGSPGTRVVPAQTTSINVEAFFASHLLPEIADAAVQRHALARAAALRFLATFRFQFSAEALTGALLPVSRLLSSSDEALQNYAAWTLERLLVTRNAEGRRKIDVASVAPLLGETLNLLTKCMVSPCSHQSEFFAKAVARVLFVLEEKAVSQLPTLLPFILESLKTAAAAPSSPAYSHFLFETLAVLARISLSSASGGDLSLQNQVEQAVVPVLSVFVKEGNHEFTPYCFQILGLMLAGTRFGEGASGGQPSGVYVDLLEHLLKADAWTSSQANVPALVRLVACYWRRNSVFGRLMEQRLPQLLERLQYCIYHKRLTSAGFEMLNYLFRFLPFASYQQHFTMLLTVLLRRAHELPQKQAFNKELTLSLLLFQARSDQPTVLVQALESIQTGLFQQVACLIIVPAVKSNVSFAALLTKKIYALGLARLAAAVAATEAPSSAANPSVLKQILQVLDPLLQGKDLEERNSARGMGCVRISIGIQRASRIFDEEGENEVCRLGDFDIAYSRLTMADTLSTKDLIDDIGDIPAALRSALTPLKPQVQQFAAEDPNSFACILGLIA